MLYPFLFTLFLLSPLLAEDPWGKDSSFTQTKKPPSKSCQTPLLGALAEGLIQFHKQVISPADGPRSHYLPNSSQYTLDAIRKYGFFRGYLLGCDRLMRENNDPWIYPKTKSKDKCSIKYDPVK